MIYAFPFQEKIHNPAHGTDNIVQRPGMMLRDYFAAQALPALINEGLHATGDVAERLSRAAYEFADAMLEARKVTP